MIKSITHFLIIFVIFQQLKSQISQIDQNGVKPFCDETLHMFINVLRKHVISSSLPKTLNLALIREPCIFMDESRGYAVSKMMS